MTEQAEKALVRARRRRTGQERKKDCDKAIERVEKDRTKMVENDYNQES